MANATGVVELIKQQGNATNAKVGGVWYGCGFDKIPFSQGDTIAFQYVEKGNFKNIDLKSVRKVEASASTAAAPAQAARVYGMDDARQRSISFQSARNAAIEVAAIASQRDILPLGSVKNKQLDNLLAFVDDLARKFYLETEDVSKNGVKDISAEEANQAQGFDEE